MEAQVQKAVKMTKKNPNYASVRIGKDTRKKIWTDLTKINKKDYGKNVLIDEYLALAVSKVTPDDLKKLQEHSLSFKDRFQMEYREYVEKNGFIKEDEYLGKRLSGEIADPRKALVGAPSGGTN